jgi:hypothetical protein
MAYSQMEIEIIANGYELAHYPVVPNSEHVVLHLKKFALRPVCSVALY